MNLKINYKATMKMCVIFNHQDFCTDVDDANIGDIILSDIDIDDRGKFFFSSLGNRLRPFTSPVFIRY